LNNLNFGIIITARTKSKRLKKKVLLPLLKQTVIEYLITRIIKKFGNKKICLITSKYKSDDILIEISKIHSIFFYRGHAKDVLKRIYSSSIKMGWRNTINITADNPFVDLEYAQKMLKFHINKNNDFTEINKLPIGLRSYVINTNALKNILKKKKDTDTEIWGDYFKKNPDMKCENFKLVDRNHNQPKLRFTLDEIEDYKLINIISKNIKKSKINTRNLIKFIKKKPKLKKINSHIKQRQTKKINTI
tara:strand:+ start:922 stop:1662 length:741 start_codon:yes stop_codon:yes gene_type:complete